MNELFIRNRGEQHQTPDLPDKPVVHLSSLYARTDQSVLSPSFRSRMSLTYNQIFTSVAVGNGASAIGHRVHQPVELVSFPMAGLVLEVNADESQYLGALHNVRM